MKTMTLVCSGRICTSTENTLIDGEKIRFYELPADEILKEAWKKLFKVNNVENDEDTKEVLCELHFDKSCFDDNKQLKPDSIPTYTSYRKSPVSPKFSSAYDEPSVKKIKSENPTEKNIMEVKKEGLVTYINTMPTKKVKPYRLSVQIDKICLKPSLKNKKQGEIKIKFVSPSVTNEIYESLGQSIESRNGKDLPSYNQCLVCKKVFLDATHLYIHLKEHFTCDICKMEFTSKKSHSRHYKLHENESEEFPFKCHICNIPFKEKKLLRDHDHMKRFSKVPEIKLYNCKDCNISFKNDNTYRRHLLIHKQESKAYADNIKQTKAKAVQLQDKPAVEFDCRICHKKLSSVSEVESHAKSHITEKILDPIVL